MFFHFLIIGSKNVKPKIFFRVLHTPGSTESMEKFGILRQDSPDRGRLSFNRLMIMVAGLAIGLFEFKL